MFCICALSYFHILSHFNRQRSPEASQVWPEVSAFATFAGMEPFFFVLKQFFFYYFSLHQRKWWWWHQAYQLAQCVWIKAGKSYCWRLKSQFPWQKTPMRFNSPPYYTYLWCKKDPNEVQPLPLLQWCRSADVEGTVPCIPMFYRLDKKNDWILLQSLQ